MVDAPVPTYTPAERDRRWTLARTFMDVEGLDALIVYGEHEDAGPAPFYFDTWFTNDRPGAIVVMPRTGEPISLVAIPTMINDHMESSRRGDAMWVAPENVRLARHAGGIAQVLNEYRLATGTIGVVGLEPYPPFQAESTVPYKLWNDVRAQVPDAKFTSVGLAFARLIMPQSPEEIAVVRHSASIGDAMARAMVDAAAPGASESEVYAAGMAAAHVRGTVVAGMHLWTGRDPVGWGPPQWAYRPQAPRVLADGDVIAAEVFCNFGMRATQHQVTIALGDVPADFQRGRPTTKVCGRCARGEGSARPPTPCSSRFRTPAAGCVAHRSTRSTPLAHCAAPPRRPTSAGSTAPSDTPVRGDTPRCSPRWSSSPA